ncbi:hypothetical protein AMS68_005870 [Peltaster fructicola]|uniref:DAPG hydrolase PhiG domain-containing protein n=1 Tax=Peltaster fructicola TaxID=286661 RepID=A0A6H0Y012_9PEZI|nr:hypothetical protein AMS68_005870 [Peltaster fructicola]
MLFFGTVLASLPILASAYAPEAINAEALRALLARATLDSSAGIDQNVSDYYLGYKPADYSTAWAKYFNDTPIDLNSDFLAGLAASPVLAEQGVPFSEAAASLSEPGYLPLENGYTILDDGTMYLAIQTFAPDDFSGEAYDFWFSWHINDTTKYKLWYPGAHQYAAITQAQTDSLETKSSYRERYWNLTSFVDEYIGDTAYKLSIAFFDPSLMGFEVESCETGIETIVTGFVTISAYIEQDPTSAAKAGFGPVSVILAHQVRQRPDGNGMEIRSRFWFGNVLVNAMRGLFDPLSLGRNLSIHCAAEMTHLTGFLPALFQEFKDDVAT